jgi:poly(3-hydroxybutyrate) depolymerase
MDGEQCVVTGFSEGANMVKALLAATLPFLYGGIGLSAQTVGQADLPQLLANEADRAPAWNRGRFPNLATISHVGSVNISDLKTSSAPTSIGFVRVRNC